MIVLKSDESINRIVTKSFNNINPVVMSLMSGTRVLGASVLSPPQAEQVVVGSKKMWHYLM